MNKKVMNAQDVFIKHIKSVNIMFFILEFVASFSW